MPCTKGNEIKDFTLYPDKGGEYPKGTLKIEDQNGKSIDGYRYDGSTRKESFDGECTRSPGNVTDIISFHINMEKRLYYFGGVFVGTDIFGKYYVVAKTGEAEVGLAEPDPGDTGTWGGNQT